MTIQRTHFYGCVNFHPECARADERERIVALAHELGAMYPNPCGDPDCPEGQHHYGAFAARIGSETP